MAEFDGTGFEAVDAFFGKDVETAVGDRNEAKSMSTGVSKGRRSGVGAVADPSKASPNPSIAKRILQVGKKRRLDDDDDDDDGNDDSALPGPDHSEVDEDDEDLGRTAIETKILTNQSRGSETEVPSPKAKKKKKGKKERAREKGGGEIMSPAGKPGDDNGKKSEAKDETNPSKELKRRKVRSRQKNIRKDNRDVKPEHLVVGSKNYQGRPLTAETRAKLNLPEKKKDRPGKDAGGWKSSWGETEEPDALDSMPLAIDAEVKPNSRTSRKKSKFKNLR